MSITHDADAPYGLLDRLARMQVLRQFIKFCLVGATSFTIHFGTYRFLIQQGPPDWITSENLYMLVANTIGFCLAVTNGFIWNRLWTFKGEHQRGTKTQYGMFFLVNIVGWTINNAILFLMFWLLQHWGYPKDVARLVGMPLALPAVALWNFTANRYWTFAAAPGTDV